MNKPRVHVSWLSPTVWLVRWASGLVVKLEKTKTGLIRVRSIYFSGNQASMAASLDRLHSQSFEFRAERRDAKYCKGSEEYRISAKVAMLAKIEEFVIAGFLQKQAGKVIPIDRVTQTFTINGRSINIA